MLTLTGQLDQTLAMKNIKVLMVDDHRIVLEGISSLLSQFPEIDILSQEESAEEAIKIIEKYNPDILLTDLSMPDYHGNELIKLVSRKYPEVKIIVLSIHAEYFAIHNAITFGASAYLQKTCSADDLIIAIKTVLDGGTYYSEGIKKVLLEKKFDDIDYNQVTGRETEVLKLIVEGKNSTEIGTALHISSRTVDNHRTRMMRKLRVKNTAELVRTALLNQIV